MYKLVNTMRYFLIEKFKNLKKLCSVPKQIPAPVFDYSEVLLKGHGYRGYFPTMNSENRTITKTFTKNYIFLCGRVAGADHF